MPRVITNKERRTLEELGFNTTKIQRRRRREMNKTNSSKKRKGRYAFKK